MANPALKNGYLSIATELVEEFCKTNIAGNEMRIIWCVWRKTWGWQNGERKKDWDWISYSQFEKMTGMKRMSVGKSLKQLVGKRLLLKSENGYKFNQNYNEWVVGKRLPPVVKRLLPSRQKATKTGRQMPTHNRYIDTITKERAETSSADIVSVIDLFKTVNPSYKKWYANTTQRGAVSRMLDIHGFERVSQVVPFLEKSNKIPYLPTVTTPLQLEDKWAALEAGVVRMKSELNSKKDNVAFS